MNKIIKKINNIVINNIFFIILILIILFSISKKDNTNAIAKPYDYTKPSGAEFMVADSAQPMRLSAKSMNTSAGVMVSNSAESNSTKIVKSFSLNIEVKNVEKTKQYIEEKMKEVKGQVENFYSYSYLDTDNLAYNFNLKIPTEIVNQTLNDFKTLGIVKGESLSVTDKQEYYSDNENKLKNLYARRDRLRKMMANKTEKLADVIQVDRELSSVQNQIEYLEKSNQTIDNDVILSDFNLVVLPEVSIEAFNNSKWRLGGAWTEAINDLIVFGQKSVSYALKLVVFSPIILVVLTIGYCIHKKIQKKDK